eukprot:TRINITY_DN14196_c0_g2_i1.p1 TRINITY_DN14196_c0_g2~~TRINITY_DN14196_c0_g2_i1.p1  ORF type:complete len:407 (-),score=14.42 TRINITY_DN14196_c0_g2_i1:148-1368(-)
MEGIPSSSSWIARPSSGIRPSSAPTLHELPASSGIRPSSAPTRHELPASRGHPLLPPPKASRVLADTALQRSQFQVTRDRARAPAVPARAPAVPARAPAVPARAPAVPARKQPSRPATVSQSRDAATPVLRQESPESRKQRHKAEDKQRKEARKSIESDLRSRFIDPLEVTTQYCRVIRQRKQSHAVVSMRSEAILAAFVMHHLDENHASSSLAEEGDRYVFATITVHGREVQLKRRFDDPTDFSAHWDARLEKNCLRKGVVKCWIEEKNMGYITGADAFNISKGKQHGLLDYFVHRSAIQGGSCLEVGSTVAFCPGFDSTKNKAMATEVTLPAHQPEETKATTSAAIADAIDEIVRHFGLDDGADELPEAPSHWSDKPVQKRRSRPLARFRNKRKDRECCASDDE